jgi:hypothetical protein
MIFNTDAVNDISPNREEAVTTALGRKSVLPKATEDSLFNYCVDTDARYFGSLAAGV